MSERNGVIAAIISSALGGMAGAVTRFIIGHSDPVTVAAFRFGIGFAILLPIALLLRSRWPRGRDWIGVALLGVMFFGCFFIVYNEALRFTTAARGALALSTLPLLTMVAAALLGVERMTARKSTGVLIAVAGVALALASGLSDAPTGAWRGDLIMAAGTSTMALYNVWSRPFIARSSALGFVTAGMGFGAALVVALAASRGGFAAVAQFALPQLIAVLYLGVGGGAAAFFLWVFALQRTTPTRVANTMTVNPVTASLLAAAIIGEPLGLNLALGVIAVGVGIWIASTNPSTAAVGRR
ncbi:MAG TPA: DMT family transporter [Stellaceae bacterium]|nr:DMT family transporter [Stellaceae bacterium]